MHQISISPRINRLIHSKLVNLIKTKKLAKFKQGGKSVYQER